MLHVISWGHLSDLGYNVNCSLDMLHVLSTHSPHPSHGISQKEDTDVQDLITSVQSMHYGEVAMGRAD